MVRCLPEISIPAEVTLDKVQTFIHDTVGPSPSTGQQGSLPQTPGGGGGGGGEDDRLLRDIRRADVLCLVYAVLQPQLYDRLAGYWLPLLRLHAPGVPVVLVGNKIDQRVGDDFASQDALDRFIVPLMGDYKVEESCS